MQDGYEFIFEDEEEAWAFGFGSTPRPDFVKPQGVEVYRKSDKASGKFVLVGELPVDDSARDAP